ncbi:MAG: hypothetical protein WC566_10445 [Dehalococcoidia bacterium]
MLLSPHHFLHVVGSIVIEDMKDTEFGRRKLQFRRNVDHPAIIVTMLADMLLWLSKVLTMGAAVFFAIMVFWLPPHLKKQNERNEGGLSAMRTPGRTSLHEGLTIFLTVWSIFALFLCALFFVITQENMVTKSLLFMTAAVYFSALCYAAYLLFLQPIGGRTFNDKHFYICIRLGMIGFFFFFVTLASIFWNWQ